VTARVAVTGAAGFIGSHICRRLLDRGDTVVGIDNFDPYYDRNVKEERLVALLDRTGFGLVEIDVRHGGQLRDVLDGAEALIHLAARPGVRPSFADPGLYLDVNAGGTVSVLEAAAAVGVSRVVFASSSSVYGDLPGGTLREDAPDLRPISPYAASKRAAELFCQVLAEPLGQTVAALRLFTVYGPAQRPDQAVARFAADLSAGRPIRLFGDGSAERDCTFVDDAVEGIVRALDWTRGRRAGCKIVNIGSGVAVTVSRLIDLVAEALEVSPRIVEEPSALGDVRRTLADLERARTLLGYRPTVPIEQGISAFVDWFRGHYGIESSATG